MACPELSLHDDSNRIEMVGDGEPEWTEPNHRTGPRGKPRGVSTAYFENVSQ